MGTNQKRRRAYTRHTIMLGIFFIVVGVGIQQYYAFSAERGKVKVEFQNPNGTSSPMYSLEVVSTPPERAKGLMYRKELPEDQGMIFVFPTKKIQQFYMKNTYVSLDMLFLDENKTVVGILESVPPKNTKTRSVASPSVFVVELLAGSSKKAGIMVGSVAKIHGRIPRGV